MEEEIVVGGPRPSRVSCPVSCPKCGKIGFLKYAYDLANPKSTPIHLRCPAPCGEDFLLEINEHRGQEHTWEIEWTD